MRSMSSRITVMIVCVCLLFVAVTAAIGALGISGMMSAKNAGNSIAHDELTTQLVTARVATDVATAYSTSQAVIISADASARARLQSSLSDQLIPAVEAELAELEAVHADDGAAELADVARTADLWAAARRLLNSADASSSNADRLTLAPATTVAFQTLSAHLATLSTREQVDADAQQAAASATSSRTAGVMIAAVALAALVAAGLGWLGGRRIRGVLRPAQNQVEFADQLQLAQDEGEAHRLLQRHLERAVSGSRHGSESQQQRRSVGSRDEPGPRITAEALAPTRRTCFLPGGPFWPDARRG